MDYFDMWKSAWNFQKKYAEIQDSDEYWKAVIDEGNSISKQYHECRFINDLILTVISELERQSKELRKNANDGI